MNDPEACHFQPGQLVECIDDRWGRKDGLPAAGATPVKGCIYAVAALEEDEGMFFLVLREIGDQSSFFCRQFRPVQTPDIGIFHSLLAPTPAATREVEPA